jgi:hypothetical protein
LKGRAIVRKLLVLHGSVSSQTAVARLPAMIVERLRSPSASDAYRPRKRLQSIEVTGAFSSERYRHPEPSLPMQCSRVDCEGVKGKAFGKAMVRRRWVR